MKKLRAMWRSFSLGVERQVRAGNVLGLVFIVGGFVTIGLAWNGSASKNFITGQFPYLISGGVMGLALVITGCTVLLTSSARATRHVQAQANEQLAKLLSRNLGRLQHASSNGAAQVEMVAVASGDSYHRADCRILQGKEYTSLPVTQAAAEGLTPCRACRPTQVAALEVSHEAGAEQLSAESGTQGQ